jgi:hypothetical protein
MPKKVKDTGWDRSILKLLDEKKITVGVHDDPQNAQKGFYNEFGTSTVPERSFLRSTFDEEEKNYIIFLRLVFERIAKNKMTTRQAIAVFGSKVVLDIKSKMTAQTPSATDNNPLIDTGQLINSVDFEVEV